MLAFPIYVVNVEVVLPAIQQAVFFQHSLGYLCPMNQLNVGQSPPQLRGERSSSPPYYAPINVKPLGGGGGHFG